MARIGILGGTFDPIHLGHLLLGRQAREEYKLDQVWFMPSGQPPHKANQRVTDAIHRCNMIKLAIEDENGFFFSDFETRRHGYIYTAQTIPLLKETWPDHQFFFILGADSLFHIESWYHPEQVIGHINILAAWRKTDITHDPMEKQISYLTKKYGGWIGTLHGPEMEVSSEQIRSLVRKGKSIDTLVPGQVADYIMKHDLYQLGGSYGLTDSEVSETLKKASAGKSV